MKTNKSIQDKIDNTFNLIDAIEDVKVSPFFKDKVMQRMLIKKEGLPSVWSWFTPQLQLATLACVVILNMFALTQLDNNTSETYTESVDEFAQSYNLSDSEDLALFN